VKEEKPPTRKEPVEWFLMTGEPAGMAKEAYTYAGRLVPELPCPLLLGEKEWKLLYCVANKSKKELKRPYSIKEAIDYPGGAERGTW
jgi:hypothetical protein